MNERIELVSDTEVRIYRVANSRTGEFLTKIDISCGQTRIHNSCREMSSFDNDSRDALIDVLQCHRDTGSFAALADTSDVPFSGKIMRRVFGGETKQVRIEYKDHAGNWHYSTDAGWGYATLGTDLRLLPLVEPKPKIRPYAPAEAAVHLDRAVTVEGHEVPWHVGQVSSSFIHFRENGYGLNFKAFSEQCTWADDGSPCGIVEP